MMRRIGLPISAASSVCMMRTRRDFLQRGECLFRDDILAVVDSLAKRSMVVSPEMIAGIVGPLRQRYPQQATQHHNVVRARSGHYQTHLHRVC
jgi:hypothetical protein